MPAGPKTAKRSRKSSAPALPPHGLMFHHFHDQRHAAGQGSINAEELLKLLEHAGLKRILPAAEYLHRALEGTLKPNDLCLTLDDNLRCQFDVALPVFKALGLTAFWFVYTSVLQGNIERLEIYRHFRMTQFPTVDDFYGAFFIAVFEGEHGKAVEHTLREFDPSSYLTPFPFYTAADRRFRFVRDEILGPNRYAEVMDAMIRDARIDLRALASKLWMDDACIQHLHAQGHVVGLHSHTHPTRVQRLSRDDQQYEYRENYNYLRALLNGRPAAMSHPCNSYNDETLSILSELGIRIGFRANMVQTMHSTLEFPREDHANLMRTLKVAA
jgi:peptidoglycan/xylan/chitin deacetylase (PgdA/CDA1 family)